MRKFEIVAGLLVALALTLSGCWTKEDVDAKVTTVREATVKICGYLPTVATVTNILAAGDPTVLTATAISTAICAAVKTQALLGCKQVAGVCIEGQFVGE